MQIELNAHELRMIKDGLNLSLRESQKVASSLASFNIDPYHIDKLILQIEVLKEKIDLAYFKSTKI